MYIHIYIHMCIHATDEHVMYVLPHHPPTCASARPRCDVSKGCMSAPMTCQKLYRADLYITWREWDLDYQLSGPPNIYLYIGICIYVDIKGERFIHLHTYVYVHICIYIHMYVHILIYIYIYIYICVYMRLMSMSCMRFLTTAHLSVCPSVMRREQMRHISANDVPEALWVQTWTSFDESKPTVRGS